MPYEKNAPNRMLGVPDAADRLGLSTLTVYKWIANRRIGCVRLGRAVRIPESEVSRLIEVGTRPARRER
jgi:excisionase family DNA binding protein